MDKSGHIQRALAGLIATAALAAASGAAMAQDVTCRNDQTRVVVDGRYVCRANPAQDGTATRPTTGGRSVPMNGGQAPYGGVVPQNQPAGMQVTPQGGYRGGKFDSPQSQYGGVVPQNQPEGMRVTPQGGYTMLPPAMVAGMSKGVYEYNEQPVLNWNATHSTTVALVNCTLSGLNAANIGASGSRSFPAGAAAGTYSCQVVGRNFNQVSDAALVGWTVNAPPNPTLSASFTPTSVTQGSNSLFAWSTGNATSATILCPTAGLSQAIGIGSGSAALGANWPAGSHDCTVSAFGVGGTVSQTATLAVVAPALPAINASMSKDQYSTGDAPELTWWSENANWVTINGCSNSALNAGNQNTSGVYAFAANLPAGPYNCTVRAWRDTNTFAEQLMIWSVIHETPPPPPPSCTPFVATGSGRMTTSPPQKNDPYWNDLKNGVLAHSPNYYGDADLNAAMNWLGGTPQPGNSYDSLWRGFRGGCGVDSVGRKGIFGSVTAFCRTSVNVDLPGPLHNSVDIDMWVRETCVVEPPECLIQWYAKPMGPTNDAEILPGTTRRFGASIAFTFIGGSLIRETTPTGGTNFTCPP